MATTAEATPADVSVTVSSGAGAGAATTGATPATGAQQGNARLREIFRKFDKDGNGYLDADELFEALVQSGVRQSEDASTPVRNNPDELAYLRRTANEMLEKMDTNNDGKLSFEEFSTCFDSLVAASKANSADNVVAKKLGIFGTIAARVADSTAGMISPSGLTKLGQVHEWNDEQMAKLRKLFNAVDTDGSGYIERDELIAAMTLLGVDPKAKTAVRASQAKLVEDRCRQVMDATDANGDGKLDFLEFCQAVGHLQYADKVAATRAKPIANSSLVMNLLMRGMSGKPSLPTSNAGNWEAVLADPSIFEKLPRRAAGGAAGAGAGGGAGAGAGAGAGSADNAAVLAALATVTSKLDQALTEIAALRAEVAELKKSD